MAYDVTAFTDYIARENAILTKTLFAGGDTMKVASLLTGVKGSTKIPHLSGGAVLQNGACATPSGSSVATEVTLAVEPYTVIESYCQDDLQSKFPNTMIAPGSSNGDSLAPWEEQLINNKITDIQEQLELHYWQGTAGSGTYPLFDGFIAKIDAAGTAIDGNTGSVSGSITTSNVKDIVDAMYVAAPVKVRRKDDFSILVGDDVFDLYIAKEKADNLYHYKPEHDNGVYPIGGGRGRLVRVYGLNGTNRLFAGNASHFWVGADLEDEEKVADVFYDRTDDKMYFRVKGKAGVAVNNVDEIVEFTLGV